MDKLFLEPVPRNLGKFLILTWIFTKSQNKIVPSVLKYIHYYQLLVSTNHWWQCFPTGYRKPVLPFIDGFNSSLLRLLGARHWQPLVKNYDLIFINTGSPISKFDSISDDIKSITRSSYQPGNGTGWLYSWELVDFFKNS